MGRTDVYSYNTSVGCELTCVIHLLLLETPELVLNPLEVLLGADRSEGRRRTLALGELDGEVGASVAAQRLEAAVCEGTRRGGRQREAAAAQLQQPHAHLVDLKLAGRPADLDVEGRRPPQSVKAARAGGGA